MSESGHRSKIAKQSQLAFAEDPEDLESCFLVLHRRLTGRRSPEVEISFYPYAGLKHTIRARDGRIYLRLSDLIENAPWDVQRATLGLLICRLYSLTPSREAEEIYASYAALPEVRASSLKARADRGRKQLTKARGRTHDLRKMFQKLNDEYFEGELEVRHLSWSRGQARRVLGHYDRAHDAIVLNRLLDHPLIPEFVVEYVLYHEMLHAALGEERQGRRRKIHHRNFKLAEREFVHYRRARRFIQVELSEREK